MQDSCNPFTNSATFAEASLLATPSSLVSNQLLRTALEFSSWALEANTFISSSNLALICLTATNIPNPYSALSSNNEFAQDGPLPSWLQV